MPATRKTLFLCMYLNKWHVSKVRAFNISNFYLGLQASFQAVSMAMARHSGPLSASAFIHRVVFKPKQLIDESCMSTIWNKIYVSAREGDRTKRE